LIYGGIDKIFDPPSAFAIESETDAFNVYIYGGICTNPHPQIGAIGKCGLTVRLTDLLNGKNRCQVD
jgi:hypothetical protein